MRILRFLAQIGNDIFWGLYVIGVMIIALCIVAVWGLCHRMGYV